jgi:hypothetical protein
MLTERRIVLVYDYLSAYLCVPLRLCGENLLNRRDAEERRDTQRYAEKNQSGTLLAQCDIAFPVRRIEA